MLEDASLTRGNQDDLFLNKNTNTDLEPATDALRDELAKINPDTLTPREALELLYRLKKL
jgi:DNA mismatch repair protein MutS